MGTAGWVGNGGLGGQSPPTAETFLSVQEMDGPVELPRAATKVDEKPVQNV